MTRKQKRSKKKQASPPPLPGSPSCQETGQTHQARPEDDSSGRKSRPQTAARYRCATPASYIPCARHAGMRRGQGGWRAGLEVEPRRCGPGREAQLAGRHLAVGWGQCRECGPGTAWPWISFRSCSLSSDCSGPGLQQNGGVRSRDPRRASGGVAEPRLLRACWLTSLVPAMKSTSRPHMRPPRRPA